MGRLDNVPIESMRVGGLPASDTYQPPYDPAKADEDLRDAAYELRAMHGRDEDGDPRVASLGKDGLVYAAAGVLTQIVPCRCGQHPEGTIKGSPAAAECIAAAKAASDSTG